MPELPSAQGERAAERRGAWVFDVDGCLIDSLTGTSLRPGALELLVRVGREHRVYLWSAGGAEYARTRAEQFAFEDLATSLAVVAVSPYLVEDRFNRGLDVAQAATPAVAEPRRDALGNGRVHEDTARTERA